MCKTLLNPLISGDNLNTSVSNFEQAQLRHCMSGMRGAGEKCPYNGTTLYILIILDFTPLKREARLIRKGYEVKRYTIYQLTADKLPVQRQIISIQQLGQDVTLADRQNQLP